MTLLPTWQHVLQSTFQQLPAAAGGVARSAAIPVQATAVNSTTVTSLKFFRIIHLLCAKVTMPVRVNVEISTGVNAARSVPGSFPSA
jgi:hypothetical protein